MKKAKDRLKFLNNGYLNLSMSTTPLFATTSSFMSDTCHTIYHNMKFFMTKVVTKN